MELLTGVDIFSGFYPLIISDIFLALEVILSNFHLVVIGVLIGLVLGATPGLGGTVTLGLLVPLTLFMEPHSAFIIMSAAWGGTTFGGSLSAILLNTPGTASNAATLIDGYPLTQQGKSDYAIGASAASSAVGAVFALIIFILLIPFMVDLVLLFGSSEYFWLVVVGIVIIPFVLSENLIGGLITGGLGLLLSFVGRNLQTAEVRFTFGQFYLSDGIQVIPVIIGLFAIAEVIRLISSGKSIVDPDTKEGGSDEVSMEDDLKTYTKFDGAKELLAHKFLVFRSSMIGLFMGIIPGVGGVTASFIAYAQGKEASKVPDDWGTGVIEGVIAPEASNDAKDGGQLFPTLGLGIPGTADSAVLLGALMLHGITPGPRMLSQNIDIVLIIAGSLLFSNILSSVIGLAIADHLKYLVTRATAPVLYATILIVSSMATFVLRNNVLDVFVMIVLGLVGFYFIVLNLSRISFLIAFILGGLAEQNFHIALLIHEGNYVQAFFTGYINIILISMIALILSVAVYRTIEKVNSI